MMKDHVKILFMGDDGVGKSSLIVSNICNYFPQIVNNNVLEDVVIPTACSANDTCVTLMDSSSMIHERENLKQKILLADSIIFVYDVTRLETLQNIHTLWIPLVIELQQGKSIRKPAMIVGTKIDLLDSPAAEETEYISTIMETHRFIFFYLLCSSLRLINIHEVISHAEELATYPVAPIYDVVHTDLTFTCRQEFQRIFRILDLDHDN